MSEADRSAATEPVRLDERRDGARIEIDLLVPGSLLYFHGHFPDFPVLPGVVQLHWAISLGRKLFELSSAVPETVQTKFRSVIVPNERIRLVLTYEAQRRRLSFEYRDATAMRSSGIITFAA